MPLSVFLTVTFGGWVRGSEGRVNTPHGTDWPSMYRGFPLEVTIQMPLQGFLHMPCPARVVSHKSEWSPRTFTQWETKVLEHLKNSFATNSKGVRVCVGPKMIRINLGIGSIVQLEEPEMTWILCRLTQKHWQELHPSQRKDIWGIIVHCSLFFVQVHSHCTHR